MSDVEGNNSRIEESRRFLFDRTEYQAMDESGVAAAGGPARLKQSDRNQVQYVAACWNDLLPENDQARVVWDFVEGLDLSPILEQIKSTEGHAGASAIDPRILMALWLYATLRGVGSARELDRRCGDQGEVAFRWICGGVKVNYHTLSDFRIAHVELLDQLLTQSVATLMHQGLVGLERIAHDGIRVRASAGSNSFHRRATLEECLREATAHLQQLKAEQAKDGGSSSRRQKAARQRASRERLERITAALEQMPKVEAKKKQSEKEKARVSTTDPEARVMKMANGGFDPAYNAQLAADTKSQIVTGVDVTNNGGDRGEMPKMIEQHRQRYDKIPTEYLADGGFSSVDDIEEVSPDPDDETKGGTTVYAPVRKNKTLDPHQPRPGEAKAVGQWRERMATDQAKEIYKQRGATIECVNAIARNRNLQQFPVRGLKKVRAILLWYALAHNLNRAATLRRISSESANGHK